jgi:hypothetical protein
MWSSAPFHQAFGTFLKILGMICFSCIPSMFDQRCCDGGQLQVMLTELGDNLLISPSRLYLKTTGKVGIITK